MLSRAQNIFIIYTRACAGVVSSYGICLLSIDSGDVASLPAKLHSNFEI